MIRMAYETDLSTQQDASQKNFWIPSEDENDLGAQSDQPAPQIWKKKTRRLTLPKSSRLLKRGEFFRVSREGKRLVGRTLCIDYRPAKKGRLGISASTRFGSAPERNRFKRLVREAFRLSSLPPFELNVIPRQNAKRAHFKDVRDEITQLLKSSAEKSS